MRVKKDPWFRNRLIRDGIYKAIYEGMAADRGIYLMGEGSHMKVFFDSKEIDRDFKERVITLPISEDANSNFAVGLSLTGIKPIVDVISSDFMYRTMDAVCNTMAKAAAVSYGRTMIVRAEFMTGGPTSGQRIEALFAHIPGLRVVIPSNPDDAYGLMKEAIAHPGVTIFFEDRMIEDATCPESYRTGEAPALINRARVVFASGRGPTVATYGLSARTAELALAGSDCTLIDLRKLFPLDVETVIKYVQNSGRLIVVEPDSKFLGIGAELVAQVAERIPGTRFKRLGAPHVTIPASRELHDLIVPSPSDIIDAVKEMS